ncbi:MAG: cytidine deaminase [Nocardioidaceae bacterium]|nr:MAG: cytidine deaminase [Nocardioidaceae bacterium]
MPIELTDPDDAKLVTLARATRARTGAGSGACMRDTNGRTYAGATVALSTLRITALDVALAMAISSGATGIEAAAVLGRDDDPEADMGLDALREFAGPGVVVYRAELDGTVTEAVRT